LRFHLAQVRGIIDEDPMPDWKKQNLYDAIAELEREIDKARTRIAAVIEVLGRAWDGNVRAVDALRQIVTMIQEAKATENETLRLGAPLEVKQIEARNTKALMGPKSRQDKSLNDEIPF